MKKALIMLILLMCLQVRKISAVSAYFDWTKTHILVDYGDSIEKYKNQYEVHFYVDGKESDDYRIKMATNASSFSTVLTNRVGKYTVYYQAYSDTYNIRSEQAIIFEVVDNIPPMVSVENTNVTINYGEEFNCQKFLSYSDNSCKKEEIVIEPINSNAINYLVLGVYHYPVKIIDLYGNTAEVDFYVSIVDLLSPTIRQLKAPKIQFGQKLTIEEFFVAVDNYDGDITSKIVVSEFDENQLGYQRVCLEVTDNSNNRTKAYFDVNVVDETPPELLLSTYAVKLDIANFNDYNTDYFERFILSITDNYQVHDCFIDVSSLKHAVGTYYINYYVKDVNNNESKKSLQVSLVEMNGPKVNGVKELSFPLGSEIDYYHLIEINEAVDLSQFSKVEIIENTVDVNSVGEYHVTYRCSNSSVEYTIFTIDITIFDETLEDKTIDIKTIIIGIMAIVILGGIIYFVKLHVLS